MGEHTNRAEDELAEACRKYLRYYESIQEHGNPFRKGDFDDRSYLREAAGEMRYHISELEVGVTW